MADLKDHCLPFMETINTTCPFCQQSITEEAQFCVFCGYSFSAKQESSETGECPNCGTSYKFPVPPFCSSCGYELSESATTHLFVYSLDPNSENQPDGTGENPVENESEQSEETPSGKNVYLSAAAVLGILVVVGLMLIGAVSLLQKNSAAAPNPTPNLDAIYTAAWETAVSGQTTAVALPLTPMFTVVPSPTWTPMPMPSLMPTTIPMITTQKEKEAEDFLYFYWGLIDRKDFSTAWLYQSPRFRKEVNQDDFVSFVNGFQYTGKIDVLWARAVAVTEYDATVDATLQFVAINNKQGATASHRYTLVKQNNQWAIDTAIKISTDAAPTISPSNNCAGSHGGRLHIGDTARIIIFQLSVRDAPGGEQYGQRLNVLAQGQEVTIIEEPACVAGMYFVKIQSKIIDDVGWVAEGDSIEYYLEPIK